jgi:hypothetical protein
LVNTNAFPPPSKTSLAATTKKALLKEIGVRWRKFSETELSQLSTKDDVVSKVAAVYGIDKSRALTDVDALLKGRRF